MSIGINGVARVTAPASTQTPPSPDGGEAAARVAVAAASEAPAETASALQPSKPLRFPWLSRLTSELEPTAKQKPTFPSAPPLGENIDQAA